MMTSHRQLVKKLIEKKENDIINVHHFCYLFTANKHRMVIGVRLPKRPKRPRKSRRRKDKSGEVVSPTDFTSPTGKFPSIYLRIPFLKLNK